MSVDKFGRHSDGEGGGKGIVGPRGIGFKLTSDGDYDMSSKRLVNLGKATDDKDAVNKKTLTDVLKATVKKDGVVRKYVDGVTPTSSKTYWGFGNRRLVGVANPKDSQDAVTLDTLKRSTMIYDGKAFNAVNKRIGNTADPEEDKDAVNLQYTKGEINGVRQDVTTVINAVTELKDRLVRLENNVTINYKSIENNRKISDRQIQKYGALLFRYLQTRLPEEANARTAAYIPTTARDYIDWEAVSNVSPDDDDPLAV